MSEFETISADALSRSLRGLGVNLLCRDVGAMAAFLHEVFGLHIHRLSADFAIVAHDGMVFQLHSDGTFGAHPLLGLVPEAAPRGGGAQFYLFGIDPDGSVDRADPAMVLEAPRDKPHGLREATILSPDGYAFSPARVL